MEPAHGSEPGKIRPVVIIQSDIIHEAGHNSTIACPISSQSKSGFSFLRISLNATKESGLKRTSYILADQVRAIDTIRLRERIGSLDRESVVKLQKSIKAILSL